MRLELGPTAAKDISVRRGESLGAPSESGIQGLERTAPESRPLPFIPDGASTSNMDSTTTSYLARRRQPAEAQPVFHRTTPQAKR